MSSRSRSREKTGKKKNQNASFDDAFVVAAVSNATRRVLRLSPFSRAHFPTERLRLFVTMPPCKRRGADDEVSEKKEESQRERESFFWPRWKAIDPFSLSITPTKKTPTLDSSPRPQQRAPRTPSAALSSAWPLPSPRAPFRMGPEDKGKRERRR